MSASSSLPTSSSSKPLNPSAASYEPQLIPINMAPAPTYTPLEHYGTGAPLPLLLLPHPQPQLPPPPAPAPAVAYPPVPWFAAADCYPPNSWCWYVEGESLSLYNSEKQPHPLTEVVSGPHSGMINYGSDQRVEQGEKKKKIKKMKMKMKKGQCGFLPPRFRLPRDQYKLPVVWPPRKSGGDEKKIIYSAPNLHAGRDPLATEEKMKFLDGKTSLMIKNIPNHYRSRNNNSRRSDLIGRLDHHCRLENRKGRRLSNFFKSAYDFLYLPMDFGFHLNLGFAFVNFTSPEAAVRFYTAFDKLEWSCADGRKKYCEIGVAKFQGKDALQGHFKNSSFPCRSNGYLPVIFSPPRDGSNRPTPTLIGTRTHPCATPKFENMMIMTIRKNIKKV